MPRRHPAPQLLYAYRLYQVALVVGVLALASHAASELKTEASACAGTAVEVPRLIDPQFPDESGTFPKGLFFAVVRSHGAPLQPSSIEESNCYLDLALGKEVVAAMVAGAKGAPAKDAESVLK